MQLNQETISLHTTSLGVLPIFYAEDYTESSFGKGNFQDTTIYLPILASVYLRMPIDNRFSVLGGIGFGVLPASTVFTQGITSGGVKVSDDRYLNSGFAYRAVVGVEMLYSKHAHYGWLIQYLSLSQTFATYKSGFNQVAPMIYVEFPL